MNTITFKEDAEAYIRKGGKPEYIELYYAVKSPAKAGDNPRDIRNGQCLIASLGSGALAVKLARHIFLVERRPVTIEIGFEGQ